MLKGENEQARQTSVFSNKDHWRKQLEVKFHHIVCMWGGIFQYEVQNMAVPMDPYWYKGGSRWLLGLLPYILICNMQWPMNSLTVSIHYWSISGLRLIVLESVEPYYCYWEEMVGRGGGAVERLKWRALVNLVGSTHHVQQINY